jgi:hypothetical protein
MNGKEKGRDVSLKGSINTVDLLVLIILNQLLFILKYCVPFYKTSYLNEEVNRTGPSPSVSVPWRRFYDTGTSRT